MSLSSTLDFADTVDKKNLSLFSPPYEVEEKQDSYEILFNMFGITEKDIQIAVHARKKELCLFARRFSGKFKDQFYWAFAMPVDADLEKLTAHYENGVVEFKIPRFPRSLAQLRLASGV